MSKLNRERGDASVLLMLGLLILVVGMAGAIFASSTAAVVTESDRYALDRAKLNARNGTIEMDEYLQPELASTIRELIEQATAAGAEFGDANLASIVFPTYERQFTMRGTGSTSEDLSDVTATVTIAGAPTIRTVRGPSADTGPTRLEEYRFRVRMLSTGHSWDGAIATYEHESDVLVEIEIGPEP